MRTMKLFGITGQVFTRGRLDQLPASVIERTLRAEGIDLVVNLTKRLHPAIPQNVIEWWDYPIADGAIPKKEELWPLARRIGEQLRCGRRVLIHCNAGRNRAPFVAACALVATGWTPSEALKRVDEVRPNAIANGAFREYLEGLE